MIRIWLGCICTKRPSFSRSFIGPGSHDPKLIISYYYMGIFPDYALYVTVEDAYPCKVCGKLFLTVPALAGHSKTHSMNRIREHKCGECGKVFNCNSHLKRHMLTHTG